MKLPTYPSPKPTLCLKGEVSANVDLREGYVVSQMESFVDNIEECDYLFKEFILNLPVNFVCSLFESIAHLEIAHLWGMLGSPFLQNLH